jgi:molybdate transport system substrate-binding protein
MRTVWAGLVGLIALALYGGAGPARANASTDQPIVVAAADLNPALDELAHKFEAETGHRLRLIYGSSGNLQRQIKQGAPFQLFLSADENLVFDLAKTGRTRDSGAIYAIGRLALFVGKDSPLRADVQLKDLAAALQDGRLQRLALANPEHAPYGRAAREVLQHLGLWERAQAHLVMGENVAQAAQFAATGAAQAGLVAWSLTRAPRFREAGNALALPESWHAPLRQRMVRIEPCGEVANAFYAYLQTPAARAILASYGFTFPE